MDTAGFPYRELGQLVFDPLRSSLAFGRQKKDEAAYREKQLLRFSPFSTFAAPQDYV
jgi:hypothetical protein